MVDPTEIMREENRNRWFGELDDKFVSIAPKKGIRKWFRDNRTYNYFHDHRADEIRAGVNIFLKKVNSPCNSLLTRKRTKKNLKEIIKKIGLAKEDNEAEQLFEELKSFNYPEKRCGGYCSWHVQQMPEEEESYKIWANVDY